MPARKRVRLTGEMLTGSDAVYTEFLKLGMFCNFCWLCCDFCQILVILLLICMCYE